MSRFRRNSRATRFENLHAGSEAKGRYASPCKRDFRGVSSRTFLDAVRLLADIEQAPAAATAAETGISLTCPHSRIRKRGNARNARSADRCLSTTDQQELKFEGPGFGHGNDDPTARDLDPEV